jgi:LysR family hca operon transcriptional activator
MQTTELTIHSASSPELTQALLTGKIDVAFLRLDDAAHGLEFKIVTNEPLFALLPADHRLASRRSIRLNDLAGKPFISFPKAYAPALRRVIDDHLARSGIDLAPTHEAETLPMVISLVLSTGGVSFLPAYAQRLLPPSVVARAPTIALAVAHNKSNTSPLLQRVLAKADNFIRRAPEA